MFDFIVNTNYIIYNGPASAKSLSSFLKIVLDSMYVDMSDTLFTKVARFFKLRCSHISPSQHVEISKNIAVQSF